MSPSKLILGMLAVIMAAVAGCSGSSDSAADPTASPVASAATEPTAAADGVDETPSPTTAAGPTAEPTATATPVGPPLLEGLDAPEGQIMLLTAPVGGGARPLLEWTPVAGADHYAVYVYDPANAAYWAWTGTASKVHVGGDPVLNDGVPGPSVAPGMSWAVIAYDSDLLPIAVSEKRTISP